MGTIDVDAILAALEQPKGPNRLEQWLAESEDRAAKFWRVMDKAASINKLASGVRMWDAMSGDPCPVKYNQIRLAMREREQRAGLGG